MASSTSRTPWIPDLPDNEMEVGDAFREYREALRLLAEKDGIPGLMAELTRINAAQQALSGSTLSTSLLETRTQEYLTAVDRAIPRSRPTASPSTGSERGRASAASRQSSPSPQPRPFDRLSPRAAAAGRRIAALQARNEMRERGII